MAEGMPTPCEGDGAIFAQLDRPSRQPHGLCSFLRAIDHPTIQLAQDIAVRGGAMCRREFRIEFDGLVFVPRGCWFFAVNLLERRNALRLLRPTGHGQLRKSHHFLAGAREYMLVKLLVCGRADVSPFRRQRSHQRQANIERNLI